MDRVLINGLEWKIIYTNNSQLLRRSNGTYAIGICDRNKLTIYIKKGLSYQLYRDVLIHELTHAFVCSYNYYLTEAEEEFLCEFVSHYSNDILSNADYIMTKALHKIT